MLLALGFYLTGSICFAIGTIIMIVLTVAS